MTTNSSDWLGWHAPYEDATSPLSRRLAIVQQQLRRALPTALEAPLQVISICAGQGHDLLGVLGDYPYANMVHARLVELDVQNVEAAQKRAAALGLKTVEIALGDAALLSAYEGAVPADIVLACGVFGNISDGDIFHTVDLLPQLCAADATVIWTRSRREPDITPVIRQYLADHGFAEADFIAPDNVLFSVGVNRFIGAPQLLQSNQHMFTFTTRER